MAQGVCARNVFQMSLKRPQERNGSDVYTCCMDMTKAFDLVKHSLLFSKLLDAGLPLIFLRLLMFVYMKQYANVKWNNEYSAMFSLANGVCQGGVISAILYCFYGNQLFAELRRSSYGCFVNGFYHRIFGLHQRMLFRRCYKFVKILLELTICNSVQTEIPSNARQNALHSQRSPNH